MNTLDIIIDHKRKEVAERKALYPVKLLEQSIFFKGQPISLKQYIQRPDKVGIIAEIKRKSPSKGIINPNVSVERISIGYMQAGASALSILTDSSFFGGSNEDLELARKFNFCPILRKDFIIDEYQVIEAKSIGADAILLITACLEAPQLTGLSEFARSLDLEVLVEVHEEKELKDEIFMAADLIGVNNRNLNDFTVNIETSKRLSGLLPAGMVKISESGIDDPVKIMELRKLGFQGFLIGENFMKHNRPEKACNEFISLLSQLENTVKA